MEDQTKAPRVKGWATTRKYVNPKSLHLYVDQSTKDRLNILAQKWADEGRIPYSSLGELVTYLANNFDKVTMVTKVENGQLHLDSVHRRKFTLLGNIFKHIQRWDGKDEVQAVNLLIEYMWESLADDRAFNEFIKAHTVVPNVP